MRIRRLSRIAAKLAVVGVLAATGPLFAPGIATAAPPTITLSPPVIQPGGTVEVRADCTEKTGQAAVGMPSQQALANTVLNPQPGGEGVVGSLLIPPETAPGTYTVAVLCGTAGQQGTTSLTVAPPGAANTGGGAMSSGPNSLIIAAGGVLIAIAALGGIQLAVRRRGSGG